MRERQPEQASEPEATSAPKLPAPHAVLELQRQVGNRAVTRLLAREARETFASYDQIQATYVAWQRLKASSLGLKINDPKVMAAASAATRTQVGSLNYDLWLVRRGGGVSGGGKRMVTKLTGIPPSPNVLAPPIPGAQVVPSSTRTVVLD